MHSLMVSMEIRPPGNLDGQLGLAFEAFVSTKPLPEHKCCQKICQAPTGDRGFPPGCRGPG